MLKERVQFPEKNQADFIMETKIQSKKIWKETGEYFGIPYNTIGSYWKENIRISLKDFRKICNKLNLDVEKTLEKYKGKVVFWKPERAFQNSIYLGLNKTELSPSKIKFRNGSKKLSNEKINFSNKDLKKGIVLPKTITPELAEETGMFLGDGFISSGRYECRLKGNKNNEIEYYQKIVKPIIKKVYNLEVNLKDYKTSYGFELYSKAIWEFKTKTLNQNKGKKIDFGVPEKLKINDKEVLSAILRGYFDTDGNFYFKSQGKNKNYYPVISACSVSEKLSRDIAELLEMLGFNIKIYKSKKYWEVKMNGYKNFSLYQKLIGTNQPKNIKKINEWRNLYPDLA